MIDPPVPLKPVIWVGPSRKDYRAFPQSVKHNMGYALYLAQCGGRHGSAKPLKGFGGAGVLELVEDQRGDTYRAVYTVRFATAIYVLHAFQKKSRKGRQTSKGDVETIKRRLRDAETIHRARLKEENQRD